MAIEHEGAAAGRLAAALEDARRQCADDAFANPIATLAARIAEGRDGAEASEEALASSIAQLSASAFLARAARLRARLGETDPEANVASLDALLRSLAGPEDRRLDFDGFARAMRRVHYGFVLTAHPTFALAADLQRDLVDLAIDPSRAEDASLRARILETPHEPDPVLDVDHEHQRSIEALGRLRGAITTLYDRAFRIAAELYPERWRELRPALVSVASWVGYDMDGRSDLGWPVNIAKRLALRVEALDAFARRASGLIARAKSDPELTTHLELLEMRLALALKQSRDELALFESHRPGRVWREEAARHARAAIAERDRRLVSARPLVELIERAIDACADDPLARELCVLRAELEAHGLTLAYTHVRINAVQLHNALRKSLGMAHPPDDPSHKRGYIAAIVRMIEEVRPDSFHLGSIAAEKTTARRVFMTMAHMRKRIERDEPIRFLIAETETPFTLLAALYFAKMFDIDDAIDISPLFETRTALERGARLIEEALDQPCWRAYLEKRGRLCIQTGFSDAGRYIGQLAASAMIEKIRLGVLEALERRGLGHLEVIVFDTHGESIGRGAHPSSFADRLAYFDTIESRRRYAQAGVMLRQESSYQGGDGFVHFMRDEAALAVLTRVLEHRLAPTGESEPDPYYRESDYVDEFFATIAQFNASLIANPAYASFLGAFGGALLYPSGSRAFKRQHDLGGPTPPLDHPSQIRAIPHNSILQQMGVLINVIGGVGPAIAKDPERFAQLYRASDRFRRLISMCEHGFMLSDLDVVRAYLDLFDPKHWLMRAWRARSAEERERLTTVARVVGHIGLHRRLHRIFEIFLADYLDLQTQFFDHRNSLERENETPIRIDPESRDTLHCLHALRLRLIESVMELATMTPDFSGRHAVTHDDVIASITRLDIEAAIRLLEEVFPIDEAREPPLDWGEQASYRSDDAKSYQNEHDAIFTPLGRRYELIRRISSGVTHHSGWIG